jgi:hypothetical protein
MSSVQRDLVLDYPNEEDGLLPAPPPLWRKLKKYLPKQNQKKSQGGRPRASDRAVGDVLE